MLFISYFMKTFLFVSLKPCQEYIVSSYLISCLLRICQSIGCLVPGTNRASPELNQGIMVAWGMNISVMTGGLLAWQVRSNLKSGRKMLLNLYGYCCHDLTLTIWNIGQYYCVVLIFIENIWLFTVRTVCALCFGLYTGVEGEKLLVLCHCQDNVAMT